MFEIDPARCTECVGFHATEQCAAVCPVDVCVPDPERIESEATLFERAQKLHPKLAATLEISPATSRFGAAEQDQAQQTPDPSAGSGATRIR